MLCTLQSNLAVLPPHHDQVHHFCKWHLLCCLGTRHFHAVSLCLLSAIHWLAKSWLLIGTYKLLDHSAQLSQFNQQSMVLYQCYFNFWCSDAKGGKCLMAHHCQTCHACLGSCNLCWLSHRSWWQSLVQCSDKHWTPQGNWWLTASLLATFLTGADSHLVKNSFLWLQQPCFSLLTFMAFSQWCDPLYTATIHSIFT